MHSRTARRVIKRKEASHVGRCIYCGLSEGPLSEEHITPYALNGLLTLSEASCQECAKITSALERKILRGMLFAGRAALGTRTRRKGERNALQPMQIEKDGKLFTVELPWQDHWKVIQLPIFDLPAHLTGSPYAGGITSNSMDVFELSEKGEEIAKRHDANRVLPPKFQNEDFARFIAKMAYGYAVERYGLSAFEAVHVLPAILGRSNDIGRWVGCSDRRELPVRTCFISVAFRIFPDRDLLVKIKMFPQFDGAEYITVVGKLKESYSRLIPGSW